MRNVWRVVVCMAVAGLLVGGCGKPPEVVEMSPQEKALVKAVDLLERGDTEAALPMLLQIVEQAPSNAVAWVNLGIAYAQMARPAQALAAYAQAAAMNETDTRPLEMAAQLQVRAKEWDGARQLLDQANRREGYSPRILTMMGVVEYQTGNVGLAEAFFSQALQADEGYVAALYNAGVLQRDGRQDMERAAGYFEAFIERAEEDDPRLATARAFVAEHRPVVTPVLVPPEPAPVSEPEAVAAPAPAEPPVAPPPPVRPAHVTAALDKAAKAIEQQAFDEALVTIKKALKQGDDPDLLWQLAELYGTHLGLASKGDATYRRFAETYPADPRALRIPSPAAAPAPATSPVKSTANELWIRGLNAHHQNDTARAMVLYKAALEADPMLFGAWHNLGLVAKAEGDLATARKAFEQALVLRKEWPDALFMLAVVRHEQGDDDRAIELLDRLLVKTTHHVKAHYLLGVIYAKRQQRVLARIHFEHVRRLDEGGSFGAQARTWIEENERTPPPKPRR
jgi:tetratricopeptide (TPR) repeat protein